MADHLAVDDDAASTASLGQPAAAPLWVWIGLTSIAAVSFWCQAAVTEERFVPALNVVATFYNIPDDSKSLCTALH